MLFMDANKHILDGPLNIMLAQEDIGLKEISNRNWPEGEEKNTFINGSIPIDGVYVTDNIEDEINMLSMSLHESTGIIRLSSLKSQPGQPYANSKATL